MVTHNKTIHRLLSLVLCLCMVLTLLPMIPLEAEAASATTLYLKPNSNWKVDNARFAAYFFGNGEKWVSMTATVDGMYKVDVPSGFSKVIFCRMNPNASANNWNNKWNQTGDLTIPTNGNDLFTVPSGAWDGSTSSWSLLKNCKAKGHAFSGETCTNCGVGYISVYFENNWKWSEVCLYYWLNAAGYNNTWRGTAMELYDNNGTYDYYVMKIPADVAGIIVSGIKDNGKNELDQTPDITSGIKDGVGYSMFYNGGNKVNTFDISTVTFPCKHKNVVDVAGTAATCTTTGLTAGTKCADCGEPIKAQTVIDALGHKWTEATCDAPKTCSVCKTTEGAALGHSYKNDCDATCDICGDVREVGEHRYVYGCDTICYMCNEVTRPDAVHVSNMYPCCDGVCQYGCGTQMPATSEHTYDNACDFECNVCYGHREVPDHVYENACDAECNICGDVRWVPGHSYDGDCDTDCNICGDVREPGEHRYLYSCDTDCCVCGQRTRPEATHLSDYPCKAGACLFGCGTEVPASSDHNWNCYYEQAPNCGFDGAYYYQCLSCGDRYEEHPSATGEHIYANNCDTKCAVCGKLTRPEAVHVSNAPSCKDGVCLYCGIVTPATEEHSYNSEVTDPDCVNGGYTTYTCSVCGDSYVSEYTEALGHNWCDATCTDPKICDICYTTEGEPAGHGYLDGFEYIQCDGYHEVWCADCWNYSYEEAHTYENHMCICGAAELLTITFMNGDEIWDTFERYYDSWVAYVGEVEYPTKEGYTFTGWYTADGEKIENKTVVTDHMVLYAGFKINTYTVTWIVDGVAAEEVYEYGQTPVFTGSTDKAQDGCSVYTFDGWDQPIAAVTGEATYTAVYTQSKVHSFEATEYVWAEDYSNCTASRTCGVCGEAEYETLEALVSEEIPATCQEPAVLGYSALFIGVSWAEAQMVTMVDPAGVLNPDNHVSDTMIYLDNGNGTHNELWSCCGAAATVEAPHADADKSGRCDDCHGLMAPAQLRKVSVSLKGNIAVNYYMLLSEEVLADDTAYMYFKLVDGELTIPVSEGIPMELEGETYYVYTCAVDAKEMTDTITSQFFYGDNVTKEHTYSVQTYGKHILANYDDQATKDLIVAMLNYGAASQLHFGYNTDVLANDIRDDQGNALIAAPDYSDMTIEGFNAVAGQGTALAKFYSASLILKSETTVRFFFQVDSAADFTASYKDQELTVSKRGSLYYVDVVGISAKDLDENVVITVNDGTNSADVSFNPMSYCQGVLNDTTGAFTAEMQDLVCALYLYNQAANVYFKEV